MFRTEAQAVEGTNTFQAVVFKGVNVFFYGKRYETEAKALKAADAYVARREAR